MKILKSLVLIALVAVTFASCKKDETTLPAPVISFLNGINETTVNPGANYTIAGTISAEEGLSEVKYFQVTATGETQIGLAITSFDNANIYSFQKTFADITEQTVVKVMATDKKNQTSVLNFTIKVSGNAIATYNDVVLGSYSSTTGSSFASLNGTVYQLTDAKTNSSKIDIIFFYGNTNNATLSAPSNLTDLNQVFTTASAPSTWTVKNDTKLEKVTVVFENVTTGNQIPNIQSTGTEKVSNVAVGDVIAFRTASTSDFPNKNGLVKIVSITGTGATATIKFNVKVVN